MEKKYILTDETIQFNGKTLYRIKAIKNFGNVKDGDLGGWVESINNLSQFNNCWIYNEAKAMDKARVSGNGKLLGNVIISGNVNVHGNAWYCITQKLWNM